MKSLTQLLDPFLIIGLVFSIALSFLLVLIGQDEFNSLMIGLIATLITLAIDIIARFKETEERILKAITGGEVLLKDEILHSKCRQIAKLYIDIQKNLINYGLNNFTLFTEKSQDILLDSINKLKKLEKGLLEEVPGGKFTYGKRGVDEAQEILKFVSYEEAEIWRDEHSDKVLIKANADAIKRGIKIQRVFIISSNSIDQPDDILQKQKEIGVDVRYVTPEDLQDDQLLESFQIVDDKILIKFFYSADRRRFIKEEIYIDPEDVKKAIRNFDRIVRRSKEFNKNYGKI